MGRMEGLEVHDPSSPGKVLKKVQREGYDLIEFGALSQEGGQDGVGGGAGVSSCCRRSSRLEEEPFLGAGGL